MMHNLKLPSHIPLASSYDPITFAKIRVDGFNREKVPSADYDCPKCLNRELIAFLREDGNPGFMDCDCKAVRRSIRAMKESGLEAVIRDLTFDRFQATEPWQKRILSGCQAYAAEPKLWLLLCGQSGCGKTHLTLAAVGYRIFHRGQSVTFLDWRKFNTLRETRSEEFYSLLKKAEAAQILFIDDLLKLEKTRTFHPAQELELAFQILNHRVNQAAITVISTELTPEQLLQMDEATGSRILHMTKQFKHTVSADPRKNHRLRREPTEETP